MASSKPPGRERRVVSVIKPAAISRNYPQPLTVVPGAAHDILGYATPGMQTVAQ